MQKYSARWFFDKFKNKVCEKGYLSVYKKNKLFTKQVTNAINEIITIDAHTIDIITIL